jgi:sigma-B regulation protein RsbU (phosphoserine phosphatase)
LLIEPNRVEACLLEALLAEVSGCRLEVETHAGLAGALGRLNQGGIDVVLLDLSLPDAQGLDTFLRLHALAPRMPVVLLSGRDDETVAVRAVQAGAEDYLVKGRLDAAQLGRSIRYAIERTRRRHAEQELRATRVKLDMARQIQQRLFPADAPRVADFDIAGASYCAEATGGDYYDYFPMPDRCLGIAIADVCGHGFGPALLMASTRAYLRALGRTHRSVGGILGLVNGFLSDELAADCFVTLLLVRFDPRTGRFVYASAGHPTGYILDTGGSVRLPLKSTGCPLGVNRCGEFPAAPECRLDRGEILLLLTDGVLEARSPAGGAFGLERALNVVRGGKTRPAREITSRLYGAVRDFCSDRPPPDDVTAIVVKAGP